MLSGRGDGAVGSRLLQTQLAQVLQLALRTGQWEHVPGAPTAQVTVHSTNPKLSSNPDASASSEKLGDS